MKPLKGFHNVNFKQYAMKFAIILFILISVIFTIYILVILAHNFKVSLYRNKLNKVCEYVQTTIVNSISEYYRSNGEYPSNLELLQKEGYLKGWLFANPLSENKQVHDESFNQIHTAGNFSYIPIEVNHVITDYYIFVYGNVGPYDVNGDGKGDLVYYIIKDGQWIPDAYVYDELENIAQSLKENYIY
jgi:hypothetical protein